MFKSSFKAILSISFFFFSFFFFFERDREREAKISVLRTPGSFACFLLVMWQAVVYSFLSLQLPIF